MRTLALFALIFAGCIEAPPSADNPRDQGVEPDSGSQDLGSPDSSPDAQIEDMAITEDMPEDSGSDMPAQGPFVVTIATNFSDFEVTQPLFGSIQDERLRDMRNVRFTSNSPIETSTRREDVIGFWIQLPMPTHSEEVTITDEPQIDTLMWQNYHHVFHMDGNQNARRSSSSLANITGMSSAIGQVGMGAGGIGNTDFQWGSGNEFTIMFWFRDLSGGGSERLITFSPVAIDFDEFGFALVQGAPVFNYNAGTMSMPVFQQDSDFHHLALVHGGTDGFEFYVDGEMIGRGPGATSLAGTYQIEIGDITASDNIFDEFWIEKSALTAQEIETIYRNQLGEITISN